MNTSKNILLYEPNETLRATLTGALKVSGFDVTNITKMPTVLPNDAWLVAGGDDPVAHTALLRDRLDGASLDDPAPCFHLLPAGEPESGSVLGIMRPFRLQDFVSALRTVVGRPRSMPVAGHILHVARRQLAFARGPRQGEAIALTEKEVAILLHLAGAKGPVPRDVLLHEVWGYHPDATTHTLETHIYRLRKKIETDAEQPHIVITTDAGYALG